MACTFRSIHKEVAVQILGKHLESIYWSESTSFLARRIKIILIVIRTQAFLLMFIDV